MLYIFVSKTSLHDIFVGPRNSIKAIVNKRYRIPKGQSKMNNQKKLATQDGKKTKQRHNPICVRHRYVEANTKNVKLCLDVSMKISQSICLTVTTIIYLLRWYPSLLRRYFFQQCGTHLYHDDGLIYHDNRLL